MATAAHTTQTHTTGLQALTFAANLETLATDIGRLKRRINGDEYALHLADRVAFHVDGIDAYLQPTAAELHQDGWSLDGALAHVDARARHIGSLLGECAR